MCFLMKQIASSRYEISRDNRRLIFSSFQVKPLNAVVEERKKIFSKKLVKINKKVFFISSLNNYAFFFCTLLFIRAP